MERRATEAALVEGARAVASGGDLAAVLGRLTAVAVDGLGYERALLYLWDEVAESLTLAQEAVAAEAQLATGSATGSLARIALGDTGATARAARERRPVNDDGTHAVPIVLASEGAALAGVLEARAGVPEARRTETGQGSSEALAALADLAAVAIEQNRLRGALNERSEWFERLSQMDPLTGLANRTTLLRAIELELARAARQENPVALVLFDVADITGLTERLGPATANDILRRTAAILTENVRLVDTVARYGPDEFAVLAPGAAGAALAKRIVAAAENETLDDGTPIRLRSGMAVFPDDGRTAADLLGAAERALEVTAG